MTKRDLIYIICFLPILPVWLLSWVIPPLKDVCARYAFGVDAEFSQRLKR